MNAKKLIAGAGVLVVVAVAIVLVVVASRDTQQASGSTLEVTINSWIGWAPLYLAKEKGFYGDVDLDINRVLLARRQP